MFDSFGNDRLTKWREFREQLDHSSEPCLDVAKLWSRAPFVSPYLDPLDPLTWPDPWHLILDNRYDDLAIALGMLYTLKLSTRFIDSHFEIHMSMLGQKGTQNFFVVVDKNQVLNQEYGSVTHFNQIATPTSIIWAGSELP
jgi:hypothetical protein